MQKYENKLEPMDVPTEQMSRQKKTVFRRLPAQVRGPVSHLLPQFAYAVSKTAQKPEDEGDLHKLGVKVKVSASIPIARPVNLVKPAVLTAVDASFTKDQKERSQGGFITTIIICGVEHEPQSSPWSHVIAL